jgi:hypothetical protein
VVPISFGAEARRGEFLAPAQPDGFQGVQPGDMIRPEGIGFVERDVRLYWLLKNVRDRIDLNWMSVAPNRRNFPAGTEGSHTSEDEDTCFIEVNVRRDAPPSHTYLLRFKGTLCSADYRSVPSADFTGRMYGSDQSYSREVFIYNSGEFRASGADSILHHSAARFQLDRSEWPVVALFPEARPKLTLEWLDPVGLESPEIPIVLFGGETVSSLAFPRQPDPPHYTFNLT